LSSNYIGIFDSGLGGLTAVKELMHLLPNEPIVYFGDTGRVPYGSKSNDTIIKYTKSDIRFLNTFDLKLIVIACGTASTIALRSVEGMVDVPVFGVVGAAAKAAVAATENKRIGIIGTAGSIRSGAYERLIAEIDESIFTISKPCPLFVPLVENGFTTGEIAQLAAKHYLTEMKEAGVDTLIMGCTHYPLLAETIGGVMGHHVTLIDPGRVTAGFVKDYLEQNGLLCTGKADGQYQFFVSDCPDDFAELGSKFLQQEIPGGVEKIDIEKYM
jgi:glutamate racemase